MFKGGKPDWTLRILSKHENVLQKKQISKHKFNLNANFIDLKGVGEGESISIIKKMQLLEDQFMSAHHAGESFSKS